MTGRDRYAEAVGLIDDAERAVREAERTLARAQGAPTAADVCETEVRAALELQDRILEVVSPQIEARRKTVDRQVADVIRALRGAPGSERLLRHRRYHSAAVKSRLIRRFGAQTYARLPW